MWNLEQILEETVETDTTSIHVGRLVAKVHRPKGPFKGLQISANENEVRIIFNQHVLQGVLFNCL